MPLDFFRIRQLKKGDQKAIDELIGDFYPDIYKYCYHHTYQVADAEDLTQETFFKFFQNIDRYQHQEKLKNYLYTIAGNLIKDHYKRHKAVYLEDNQAIKVAYERGQQGQVNSSGLTQANDVDNQLLLEWALSQIDFDFRQVIVLYYFNELKINEIATILEIKPTLVKYRLKRGKSLLENLLREEDNDEEARGGYQALQNESS